MEKCKICLSERTVQLPPQPSGFYIYAACKDCGVIWAMDPSLEAISERYLDPNYVSERNKDYMSFGGHRAWKNSRLLFNSLLEKSGIADFEEFLGEKGYVLDVGCGEGDSMEVFRFRDWDVVGIDANPHLVEYGKSRGRDIQCLALEEASFAVGSYDMVFASHIIEHLVDPMLLFRKSQEFLKSQGRLVIVTPVYAYFGDQDHVFFFNQKNLEIVGDRGGFRLLSMITYEDINPAHKHWCPDGVVNGFFTFEKKG
ncbi:MAG: class I SAM-dependent methyltransferase [Candidatus Omnitrophica bacterium]|nr:class I SAM-dependent methyltransferase [Candidatus Omnitrophota bacterium]MBU1932966.1 class I SAM-dependent methyltransferase [Candidatus Omnitrophota bacterium]